MATGRAPLATAAQGPPSEREFIRVLRERALGSVDLSREGAVVGLTPTELEAHTGLSRPSVSGLIKRFEPILEAQDLDGTPVGESDQGRRWALDASAGVLIGIEIGEETGFVAGSDLYGRITREHQLKGAGVDETVDEAVATIRGFLV